MKLWQKSTNVNKTIEEFTVGNDRELDLLLAPFDVLGSMAHIIMLEKVGLLNQEELNPLLLGLRKIKDRIDRGEFEIEEGIEDALEVLDGSYASIGKILERPLFFDSAEVRSVLNELGRAQNAVLIAASAMSAEVQPDDDEES